MINNYFFLKKILALTVELDHENSHLLYEKHEIVVEGWHHPKKRWRA